MKTLRNWTVTFLFALAIPLQVAHAADELETLMKQLQEYTFGANTQWAFSRQLVESYPRETVIKLFSVFKEALEITHAAVVDSGQDMRSAFGPPNPEGKTIIVGFYAPNDSLFKDIGSANANLGRMLTQVSLETPGRINAEIMIRDSNQMGIYINIFLHRLLEGGSIHDAARAYAISELISMFMVRIPYYLALEFDKPHTQEMERNILAASSASVAYIDRVLLAGSKYDFSAAERAHLERDRDMQEGFARDLARLHPSSCGDYLEALRTGDLKQLKHFHRAMKSAEN